MKTILAFLLLSASALAQGTISIDYTAKQQAAIESIVTQFNADSKTQWDAAEAAKKVSNPSYVAQPYVPVKAPQYLKARFADLLSQYAAQVDDAEVAVIRDALKQATAAKRKAALDALK